MSIHVGVFLIGLFGVPLALLWVGQRIRKASPRARRAFWGAIIGHCLAGSVAVVFSMIPPEAWTSGETVRGFFGLWSLVLGPAVGLAAGMLFAPATAAVLQRTR